MLAMKTNELLSKRGWKKKSQSVLTHYIAYSIKTVFRVTWKHAQDCKFSVSLPERYCDFQPNILSDNAFSVSVLATGIVATGLPQKSHSRAPVGSNRGKAQSAFRREM